MDRRQLIQDLHNDEGCVLHAYKDSLGFLTIGVGRLIDGRKGGGITEAEADYLLGNDIDYIYGKLKDDLPWFLMLSEGRQRALCNMAFQLGIDGLFNFKKTLYLISVGEYLEASKEAMRSKWARQTPERATRVSRLLANG